MCICIDQPGKLDLEDTFSQQNRNTELVGTPRNRAIEKCFKTIRRYSENVKPIETENIFQVLWMYLNQQPEHKRLT